MKLHEYNEAIERCFRMEDTDEVVDAETGEIFDASYLDDLVMEKDSKIKSIVNYILSLEDDEEALDKQIKKLNAWKKSKKNKIENLKSYLKNCLCGEKWVADDESCKVSYRVSRDVVTVDDLSLVPDWYFKTPHYESNLDKTSIKEVIKSGETIPGIHLQDNSNIQIK